MFLTRVLFSYSDEFDELSRTLRFIAHYNKKWMNLSTVLFSHYLEFKKLFHILRFITQYVRNEWFSLELASAILMNSINYPTHWNPYHITLDMNCSHQSWVQLFRWIGWIVPHIDIHRWLDKKWVILSTVLFKYSDEFRKICDTLRFMAQYVRNEWFSP